MKTITTSFRRPLTDLMPIDFLFILLYASCLSFPPGSALLNVGLVGVLQWFYRASRMDRLLPGLYMNRNAHTDFKEILNRYEQLKSRKKEGLLSVEEKKELLQLKETIVEFSPKPQFALYKYRPDLILVAVVIAFSFYRLHVLFPEPMKLLFGESVWHYFQ